MEHAQRVQHEDGTRPGEAVGAMKAERELQGDYLPSLLADAAGVVAPASRLSRKDRKPPSGQQRRRSSSSMSKERLLHKAQQLKQKRVSLDDSSIRAPGATWREEAWDRDRSGDDFGRPVKTSTGVDRSRTDLKVSAESAGSGKGCDDSHPADGKESGRSCEKIQVPEVSSSVQDTWGKIPGCSLGQSTTDSSILTLSNASAAAGDSSFQSSAVSDPEVTGSADDSDGSLSKSASQPPPPPTPAHADSGEADRPGGHGGEEAGRSRPAGRPRSRYIQMGLGADRGETSSPRTDEANSESSERDLHPGGLIPSQPTRGGYYHPHQVPRHGDYPYPHPPPPSHAGPFARRSYPSLALHASRRVLLHHHPGDRDFRDAYPTETVMAAGLARRSRSHQPVSVWRPAASDSRRQPDHQGRGRWRSQDAGDGRGFHPAREGPHHYHHHHHHPYHSQWRRSHPHPQHDGDRGGQQPGAMRGVGGRTSSLSPARTSSSSSSRGEGRGKESGLEQGYRRGGHPAWPEDECVTVRLVRTEDVQKHRGPGLLDRGRRADSFPYSKNKTLQDLSDHVHRRLKLYSRGRLRLWLFEDTADGLFLPRRMVKGRLAESKLGDLNRGTVTLFAQYADSSERERLFSFDHKNIRFVFVKAPHSDTGEFVVRGHHHVDINKATRAIIQILKRKFLPQCQSPLKLYIETGGKKMYYIPHSPTSTLQHDTGGNNRHGDVFVLLEDFVEQESVYNPSDVSTRQSYLRPKDNSSGLDSHSDSALSTDHPSPNPGSDLSDDLSGHEGKGQGAGEAELKDDESVDAVVKSVLSPSSSPRDIRPFVIYDYTTSASDESLPCLSPRETAVGMATAAVSRVTRDEGQRRRQVMRWNLTDNYMTRFPAQNGQAQSKFQAEVKVDAQNEAESVTYQHGAGYSECGEPAPGLGPSDGETGDESVFQASGSHSVQFHSVSLSQVWDDFDTDTSALRGEGEEATQEDDNDDSTIDVSVSALWDDDEAKLSALKDVLSRRGGNWVSAGALKPLLKKLYEIDVTVPEPGDQKKAETGEPRGEEPKEESARAGSPVKGGAGGDVKELNPHVAVFTPRSMLKAGRDHQRDKDGKGSGPAGDEEGGGGRAWSTEDGRGGGGRKVVARGEAVSTPVTPNSLGLSGSSSVFLSDDEPSVYYTPGPGLDGPTPRLLQSTALPLPLPLDAIDASSDDVTRSGDGAPPHPQLVPHPDRLLQGQHQVSAIWDRSSSFLAVRGGAGGNGGGAASQSGNASHLAPDQISAIPNISSSFMDIPADHRALPNVFFPNTPRDGDHGEGVGRGLESISDTSFSAALLAQGDDDDDSRPSPDSRSGDADGRQAGGAKQIDPKAVLSSTKVGQLAWQAPNRGSRGGDANGVDGAKAGGGCDAGGDSNAAAKRSSESGVPPPPPPAPRPLCEASLAKLQDPAIMDIRSSAVASTSSLNVNASEFVPRGQGQGRLMQVLGQAVLGSARLVAVAGTADKYSHRPGTDIQSGNFASTLHSQQRVIPNMTSQPPRSNERVTSFPPAQGQHPATPGGRFTIPSSSSTAPGTLYKGVPVLTSGGGGQLPPPCDAALPAALKARRGTDAARHVTFADQTGRDPGETRGRGVVLGPKAADGCGQRTDMQQQQQQQQQSQGDQHQAPSGPWKGPQQSGLVPNNARRKIGSGRFGFEERPKKPREAPGDGSLVPCEPTMPHPRGPSLPSQYGEARPGGRDRASSLAAQWPRGHIQGGEARHQAQEHYLPFPSHGSGPSGYPEPGSGSSGSTWRAKPSQGSWRSGGQGQGDFGMMPPPKSGGSGAFPGRRRWDQGQGHAAPPPFPGNGHGPEAYFSDPPAWSGHPAFPHPHPHPHPHPLSDSAACYGGYGGSGSRHSSSSSGSVGFGPAEGYRGFPPRAGGFAPPPPPPSHGPLPFDSHYGHDAPGPALLPPCPPHYYPPGPAHFGASRARGRVSADRFGPRQPWAARRQQGGGGGGAPARGAHTHTHPAYYHQHHPSSADAGVKGGTYPGFHRFFRKVRGASARQESEPEDTSAGSVNSSSSPPSRGVSTSNHHNHHHHHHHHHHSDGSTAAVSSGGEGGPGSSDHSGSALSSATEGSRSSVRVRRGYIQLGLKEPARRGTADLQP